MIAEEIVAAGGLLPDEIMLKVVTSKLDMLHNKVYFMRDEAVSSTHDRVSIGF